MEALTPHVQGTLTFVRSQTSALVAVTVLWMNYQSIFAKKMIHVTEGVFSYKKGWFGGECGVVNGSYCALGKNHLSGTLLFTMHFVLIARVLIVVVNIFEIICSLSQLFLISQWWI